MPYAIYKAGVPAATAVATKGTYGVAGTTAVSAAIGTQVGRGIPTPPATSGLASKAGQNSNNGSTVTVAPARNTPRS